MLADDGLDLGGSFWLLIFRLCLYLCGSVTCDRTLADDGLD